MLTLVAKLAAECFPNFDTPIFTTEIPASSAHIIGFAMDKPAWHLVNNWLNAAPLTPSQKRVCAALLAEELTSVVVEAPNKSGGTSLIAILKAVYERLFGSHSVVILGATQLSSVRHGGRTCASYTQQHKFAELDACGKAAKIREIFGSTSILLTRLFVFYMLTAEQMDTMDLILRTLYNNSSPFGGRKVCQ